MTNYKKSFCLLLGATLFMGSLGMAWADDCSVISATIGQERVLMKKKALVDAALATCPADPGIAYQNGYVLERLRKYQEALDSYKKAITLDPGYAKAYFSVGDIYILQKDYEKAVEAYSEGLLRDPGDERAKSSLAEALVNVKGKGGKVKEVKVQAVSPAPIEKETKTADSSKSVKEEPLQYLLAPIIRLDIPFHEKTAVLSQEAKDVLSVVVGQAMNRDDMRNSQFEIGGYTDNTGDASKNDDISKQRAVAVQKFLTDNFAIGADRLKTAYHGAKNPKVANDSPAKREINNRVAFAKVK